MGSRDEPALEHLQETAAYSGVNRVRKRTAQAVNEGGTAGIPVPCGDWIPAVVL